MPPRPIQLEAMCKEVARIMHENYVLVAWGGDGHRWELMCLVRGGNNDGSKILRGMIAQHFADQQAGSGASSISPNHPLLGSRAETMTARESTLSVLIDSKGTTWAKAGDLLRLYDLPFIWDSEKRRILIG